MQISDTLRQPPPAKQTMAKAINIGESYHAWRSVSPFLQHALHAFFLAGVSMAGGFYMTASVLSYQAFGNAVPGNVLQGFDTIIGELYGSVPPRGSNSH
jgi:hypothetical protein